MRLLYGRKQRTRGIADVSVAVALVGAMIELIFAPVAVVVVIVVSVAVTTGSDVPMMWQWGIFPLASSFNTKASVVSETRGLVWRYPDTMKPPSEVCWIEPNAS